MKPLIRPFLLGTARLGLFLTLIAWIAGQWWALEIDNEQRDVHLRIDDRGWLVTDLLMITRRSTDGWQFALKSAEQTITVDMIQLSQIASSSGGLGFEIPGVCGGFGKDINSLIVYHWTLVAAFSLFYVALKWRSRAGNNDVVDVA